MNRIGTPDYVGADGAFSTCSVMFGEPVGAKEIVSISVAMSSRSTGTSGKPVTVGDTTVQVTDSRDFCSAYLPVDDKMSLRFQVTTKGDLMDRGPKFDLCPETAAITAAAASHLGDRPLRANSTRAHMNTKLARLDPCAVLSAFAQEHPAPYVNPSPNPWECIVNLDWGDNSTGRNIEFSYDSDAKLTRSPGSHEVESRIDGLPTLEAPGRRGSTYADACQIYIGTDPNWAPAKGVHDRRTEMIMVSVQGGGCDAARTVATETVRLYKQLPE
ncbi:hypothetical protein BJY24_003639 [Nocardia transvalensis]|uniref:Uncharacterized protein n=1 Tax=Nocardia transvalensis TaxID=37333 RepID=A0A7W9PEU3_9NOCA|nr:hypothetical protein [Nocardia transvalensis]MBB5914772.1 hypothetical protein [Nocardia transvalensis]